MSGIPIEAVLIVWAVCTFLARCMSRYAFYRAYKLPAMMIGGKWWTLRDEIITDIIAVLFGPIAPISILLIELLTTKYIGLKL